jgi:hypothetical protein
VRCASYRSILLYCWLVRKHENRGRNFYIKLAWYEKNSAYRKKTVNYANISKKIKSMFSKVRCKWAKNRK